MPYIVCIDMNYIVWCSKLYEWNVEAVIVSYSRMRLTGGPGNDQFNCGAGNDKTTDLQPGLDIETGDCE